MLSSRPQVSCPKCGQPIQVESIGHLEIGTCQHCGWTDHSTVYFADDVKLIDESFGEADVFLKLSTTDTLASQVAKARLVFQQLAEKPIGELFEQAKHSPSLALGTFALPMAIEIQEVGKRHGLHVSLVKKT